MRFSWDKIKRPIVALAPMAGYTDSAFRQIAKKIAPEIVCFSELTSISAINHNNEKTLKMLRFDKSELPLIIQLFGKDPAFFVEAGKKLEQMGVCGIDINMGCPAKKVLRSEQGSALIKKPELAAEIIHQLSKAIRIPVSVKTRIGYSKYDEPTFLKFIKDIESAGAKLLTIHGRTTKQSFTGEANFEPIYLAKKTLKIPVIGNGDVTSPEIAKQRIADPKGKITLDGLMVGRATFGNPWLLQKIYAALHDKKYSPPTSLKAKIPTIKQHFLLELEILGEKVGILEIRKHLLSYIKGFEKASYFRQKILQTNSPKEILEILDEAAL